MMGLTPKQEAYILITLWAIGTILLIGIVIYGGK